MVKEKYCRMREKAQAGFTMVELMVSVFVMMVIAAIAVPTIIQGWNSYLLTSAADSIAGTLQRTRFEAIHRNARLACVGTMLPAGMAVGIDENGNGTVDPGEPQSILNGAVQLLAAGVAPAPAGMGAAYAAAVIPPGTVATFGSVFFSARGTPVTLANLTAPYYVVYLGIPGQPRYGYRAVTITPMGQVKVWQAPTGGAWTAQ